MIIHYSSRVERRRDLASPCSLNTLCNALQVIIIIVIVDLIIIVIIVILGTHCLSTLYFVQSSPFHPYFCLSRKVLQDYSGWASYMGAGAILCCLASALAGIIYRCTNYQTVSDTACHNHCKDISSICSMWSI